mmetsp:Transcript_87562/g.237387  ORF Transcript_87562/g.237387 Transcript_87562/m.237387 type:complete len:311 (+) Transcript_87562:136-1068(+)
MAPLRDTGRGPTVAFGSLTGAGAHSQGACAPLGFFTAASAPSADVTWAAVFARIMVSLCARRLRLPSASRSFLTMSLTSARRLSFSGTPSAIAFSMLSSMAVAAALAGPTGGHFCRAARAWSFARISCASSSTRSARRSLSILDALTSLGWSLSIPVPIATSKSRSSSWWAAPRSASPRHAPAHHSPTSPVRDRSRVSAECQCGSRKLDANALKSLLLASAGSPGPWVCLSAKRLMPLSSVGASLSSPATRARTSASNSCCSASSFSMRASTENTRPFFRCTTASVRLEMTAVACLAPPLSFTGDSPCWS